MVERLKSWRFLVYLTELESSQIEALLELIELAVKKIFKNIKSAIASGNDATLNESIFYDILELTKGRKTTEEIDTLNRSLQEPMINQFFSKNHKKIIYRANFENYNEGDIPSEFIIFETGKGSKYQAITSSDKNTGFKSLQVWGSLGKPAEIHYYFNMPKSGKVGYEVSIKPSLNRKVLVQLVNPESPKSNPSTWGLAGVFFTGNGYITAPGNFEKYICYKKWHKIKAEMDTETGTYCLWLDDKLITDEITPEKIGNENPGGYMDVSGIVLGDELFSENAENPVYFDDFMLYNIP
jgi:hypothetical protein